ncbi:MAG: hypothetical protein GY898_30210 [Proteobacteria bacterium]|nr:hypothetical protein [Pseudomonadota bacterium]
MRRTLLALAALFLIACPTTEPEPGTDDDDDAAPDADGDGFDADSDCNDADELISPDADEVCDGVDNDCDGDIDNDANDAVESFPDADEDGFGDEDGSVFACTDPDGNIDVAGDCDDGDDAIHPDANELCDRADNDCDGDIDEDVTSAPTWYGDADGDGFGTDADTTEACDAPPGYVSHDGDCDDADPAWHPGAAEADCTDPNDYNCDGSVGYADVDADGIPACEDCDDSNDLALPGGSEVCNGADNDCNGVIDDGAPDAPTWYADADGDGFAGDNLVLVQCDAPAGYFATAEDCDDLDPTSNPDGIEVCDEADNDCDTFIDEDVGTTWFEDADADGYGTSQSAVVACAPPAGYVGNDEDCNDALPATNPGSYEVCDGVDNDCDGFADEADAINATTWFEDLDGDTFGTTNSTTEACAAPFGFTDNTDDCDDGDEFVFPGAVEVCNGADDDCDGVIDDDATGGSDWYFDDDGDGAGDPAVTTVACDQPAGYVGNAEDCDDDDDGSTLIPDDADCDGTETDGDCDDNDDTSTIVAEDADCDGTVTDDDCDDNDDTSTIEADDADCDTYLPPGDCDDTDPSIFPGAPETPGDGVDSNCDGLDDPDNFSGTIEMPAAGTVDGYQAGPWSALNGGGRAVSRLQLSQGCTNPELSLFQHASADTSIQGSYYVLDESGTLLDATNYETWSGCNDCWLPGTRLTVQFDSGNVYWIGFSNGAGGDMSGPSIYEDSTVRTVGVATFDQPRADDPPSPTQGLPSTTVNWQNRWRIDCE